MKNALAIPQLDARVKAALHYHELASASAAQMAIAAAKCGLELRALKKECPHGEWETLFAQHFGKQGLQLRTAQKYMALAEGVKSKALKNERVSFLPLLETAPSKLSNGEQLKLTKEVTKLTDGQTLSDLYQEFGIVKKPQGSGAKGGATKKSGNSGTSDADEKPVETAEVLAEGKRASVDTLCDLLNEQITDKKFFAATKETKKKLHGLLIDLAAAVKEVL